MPYIFSGNTGIGIKFAVNVATPTYYNANITKFHLYDASNNPVGISKVERAGDGTSNDENRNYLFVAPQSPLQPSITYKIIIDADLTANNGQQAGKQQEVGFTTAADTTRPAWTSGALTASSVTSASLTLSWSGASDDVAVANYRIYANGSLINTVSGLTTICNITGLNAGAVYDFQVQALDAAGNESAGGPNATATTATGSSDSVSLTLSKTSAPVKSSVTASGAAAPVVWVSIKVVDGTSPAPLYYNAVKSDAGGNYTDTFRVPVTPGALTVVAGYGDNVATAALTATALTEIASDVTVTGESNKNLEITGSTPDVEITVPSSVTGASVCVSDLLSASGSGVASSALPALNITAGATINSAPVQVAVAIPAGATVSAPAGWDGTINLPAVQANNTVTVTPDSGKTATVSTVIEIGFGDVPLTFNKAVRILIPGQAGKEAGYARGGVFTKITNVLTSDSQAAGDALAAGSDGRIDAGSDLVIWTKHFTRFVTYTQTTTGGGSGGGGGSDTQAPAWTDTTLDATKSAGLVTLQWTAATDNVGVTSYKIYLDSTTGELIGTVDGDTTTFEYNEGQGTDSHTYYVQALDAAGNKSAFISATSGGDKPLSYISSNITTINGSTSTDGNEVENSASVPVRPTIRLVFDKNVVYKDVWANNEQCVSMQDSSGASVKATVFRISDEDNFEERRHIFITPESDLSPGKTYKIIISPGLKAKNGNTLGETSGFSSGKVITFTVAGSSVTTGGPTVTSGSGSVDPAVGATISQGDYAMVVIPANALKGTSQVTVSIKKVESPPAVTEDAKLVGDVYEFTVGNDTTYTFSTNVAITLSFDPSAVGDDEVAAMFYYDETQKKWVNLGGTVSGSTSIVQVDHLTKFAVFAVKKSAVTVVTPTLGTLTDIAGHWAEANIRKLVELGAVSGYPDGSFMPDNTITRAEFATILVKAFKLEIRNGNVFSDTAGHWAKDNVSTAAAFGIAGGYEDGSFGPDDLITREQMAVMSVKAAKLEVVNDETEFADSAGISEWAKSAVTTAVKNGLMKGYPDNTFQPRGNAKRAEAVTVIMNALRLQIH